MVSFLKQNRNNFWLHVCLLVLIGLIAFLPLIGKMGYYREGWHFVWGVTTNGADGVAIQYSIDRPLMGKMYGYMFHIFGTSVLAWNLFAVFLRIVGSIGVLWLSRLVIKKEYPSLVTALLFLLYPGFLQLPNGNLYQTLLMGLAAGIFSLALNIKALSVKKIWKTALLLVGSALLGAFSYFMFEWFIGIEAIRVILLVFLLWPGSVSTAKSWTAKSINLIKNIALYWSANALATAIFLYWRTQVFESLRSVTNFDALTSRYRSDLFGMGSKLVVDTLTDAFDAIFSGWFVPLYDLYKTANQSDIVIGLLIGISAAIIIYLFTRQYRDENDYKMISPIIPWIGILAIIVTIVPFVIAGREIRFEYSLDRYTLTPSIGVSFLVTWFIFSIQKENIRKLFLAVLLVISVSTHFMNNAMHRDWWEYQRQLWYQLTWRAPQLEEETVLVASLPDQYNLSEDYEIWGPANMIYNPSNAGMTVYAETLNKNTIWKMLGETREERNMRTVYFNRDFSRTLAITIPSGNNCMHVIGNNTIPDPANGDLNALLAGHSHPDLIVTEGESPQPWTHIFGPEPEHNWCWYYQKAGLAAQNNDWDQVLSLANQAEAADLQPGNITEWFPFYVAYAKNNDSEHTAMIEEKIKSNTDYTSLLCKWINQDPTNETRLSDYESLNLALCTE